MTTNPRNALIRLASQLPAGSSTRKEILSGLLKEAGILEKLFKTYKKEHPNSKAPPQSLKDEAAKIEEKQKDSGGDKEKEKADKEKEKADKEKADKEKAKAKKEKADKDVSELSDEDLDKHTKDHEEKAKTRNKKDEDHIKAQEDDDAQSGYGGRGYTVDRQHSDEEKDDAEHHERLKKEKKKRTEKKEEPKKEEPKKDHSPQYEGDEGGGVPSWVRGASLIRDNRRVLTKLASSLPKDSAERRMILIRLRDSR